MKLDVVVVGGGATGLGTAIQLQADACLFEREHVLGGCLRSDQKQGYTIDRTGHLLHFRDSYVRTLMFEELNIDWLHHERRAEVHVLGQRVPYPIQYNLHALPPLARDRCLRTFLKARSRSAGINDSFDAWSSDAFGQGLYELFFEPYNRKLWQASLNTITAEWAERFVPQPDRDLVVRGAKADQSKGAFGYNATFSYPLHGGSQTIVDALAKRSRIPIETGKALLSIDPAARICEFSDGTSIRYRSLVSTLPLPRLLELIHGVDPDQLALTNALRHNRVVYFAFGYRAGNEIPPQHWVYVPSPEYCMYRVGILSNYSPNIAPPGCVLVCAEIALPGGVQAIDIAALRERARVDLEHIGVVRNEWKLEFEHQGSIDCAYTIFDVHRRQAVPHVLRYLRSLNIQSIGRYGAWDYGSMGDALIEGRDCAHSLNAAFSRQ